MKYKIDDIIRRVAEQNGTTEEEVLDAIRCIIEAGYNSDDPEALAFWASAPFTDIPTPQQFLVYLIKNMPHGYLN